MDVMMPGYWRKRVVLNGAYTALLLVLCIGIVGYLARGAAWPPAHSFQVVQPCDLNSGPCVASSRHHGMIELSIAPNPIPLLQPLAVGVRLQGLKASAVAVIFTGVDIDMGTLRYPLYTRDGTLYQATASLSVCSERRMQWQAEVVVDADGQRYAVPFLFETEYRSRFKLLLPRAIVELHSLKGAKRCATTSTLITA